MLQALCDHLSGRLKYHLPVVSQMGSTQAHEPSDEHGGLLRLKRRCCDMRKKNLAWLSDYRPKIVSDSMHFEVARISLLKEVSFVRHPKSN